MSEIIPYVPNLTLAPENPSFKDCYYNIILDKYYIYNGTQWIEALPYEEGVDSWQLLYLVNGESDYHSEFYNNYNDLITALNREINATDVQVIALHPECIYTISKGNAKADWSLLKIWINGSYIPVGRIAPKIVFNHSAAPATIIVNNRQLNSVYLKNTLVYLDLFTGYILECVCEDDTIFTQRFSTYEGLMNFMETTNLSFKKVAIVEQEEPSW